MLANVYTHECVIRFSVFNVYCVFVYHQVQNELSQTTEKLHGEEARGQQLSEEFEQVAIDDALFFSF